MEGVFGKALIVNLAERTYWDELIPREVYENLLGGKGLGAWLLLKKNRPGVDPFSPENHFIIALGPASNTDVWGSSRYGVYTKAPLTGLFSESYSGGKVAEPMSRTGYDAFVLEGASGEPFFLEITESGVAFHDAGGIWGLDAYAAEDAITEKIGGKGVGVIVIGPAGENRVRFAGVSNNYWRCAGRTGVGAVLGSKKIKGIAFHGSRVKPVADERGVKRLHEEWLEKGKDHVSTKNFNTFGTPVLTSLINSVEAFPTRYWSEGSLPGWQAITAEVLHNECIVKPRACTKCFMACGRHTTVVKEGKYKGLQVEGPEYETIYAFGGLCVINRLEDILYLNDVCDRLGMDTITGGNLAAFAIEASLRGRIPERLGYGDTEAIAGLLHDIAYRKGPGAILAEGIRHAAKAWDLEDIAIHVKGMEPGGYDPRYFKGMGLAYATSDRGACHLRTTVFRAELVGIIPPDQIEGKAEVMIEFENRLILQDAMILCRFYRDIYMWDELNEIVKATTGMDLGRKGLERIASNIKNAARIFNLREGMTASDDTLPRRFFTEPIGSKGLVLNEADFEKMKADYYRLRGWNERGEVTQPLPAI